MDDPSRAPRWIAAASLALLAMTQVAYALALAPLLAGAGALEPSHPIEIRWLRGILAPVMVSGFGVVLAMFTWTGALGLLAGRQWGWFLGVVSAVLWLPSGCLPVSALVLVTLLHPDVRDAMLLRPAPASG